MSLLDFQVAMGRMVRAGKVVETVTVLADGYDAKCLARLRESAGYRFTAEVQRSWCRGRLERAGSFTLSVLLADQRDRLLEEWADAGGGTSSFFAAESDAFLGFIETRLHDPSHELTACRIERAALRASEGVREFRRPDSLPLMTGRGRFASLVIFHGQPSPIIEALVSHTPLPAISTSRADETAVFFAPGIEGLQRVASNRERVLWDMSMTPLAFRKLQGAEQLVREGIFG